MRVAVPELAIVDDALWTAAQARMAAAAAVYRQRTGGQAFGRPANGVESKYLLTGFGVCAGCGGSMATLKRAHGPRGHRRQVPFYGCMTRHLRGDAICANALEVRLDDAEEAVLAAVERDVLNVAVLETSLYKAMAALQASATSNGAATQVAALRDELAGLDAEVARLAEAIARGGDLPALVALLQERERRRAHVRAALAAAERRPATHGDVGDLRHVLDVMRAALTDWQGMLRQEPPDGAAGAPRAVGRAPRVHADGRLLFVRGARHDHARARRCRHGVCKGCGGSNGIRTRVSALRGPRAA